MGFFFPLSPVVRPQRVGSPPPAGREDGAADEPRLLRGQGQDGGQLPHRQGEDGGRTGHRQGQHGRGRRPLRRREGRHQTAGT